MSAFRHYMRLLKSSERSLTDIPGKYVICASTESITDPTLYLCSNKLEAVHFMLPSLAAV